MAEEKLPNTNQSIMGKVMLVLESKIVLLIMTAIIASNLCPKWLVTYATTAAERQWQFSTREKVLTALDDSVLSSLLPLQEAAFESCDVKEFTKCRETATRDLNKTLILVRLLYGTEVMEQIRADLIEPIRIFFIEGFQVKKTGQNSDEFTKTRHERLLSLVEKTDNWERKLSALQMTTNQ